MKLKHYLLLALTVISGLAQAHCILLGSKPSFIIHYTDQSSNLLTNTPLAKNQLQQLTQVTTLNFTHSKAMAGGNYLAFFKPPEAQQVCYAKKRIVADIKALKQLPNVTSAMPNLLAKMDAVKVPTPSAAQWNLSSNTAAGGIDMPTAWKITTGRPNAIVAVLDNGTVTNDALSPNLLSKQGVHFRDIGSDIGTSAESNCPACAGYDHGTHVAGIVAATGNGAYGETVYGVAYTSHVLPIDVFTVFNDSADCSEAGTSTPCQLTYTSDWIDASSWLTGTNFPGLPAAPTSVIAANMSFGGSWPVCFDSAKAAIDQLYNAGITPVVSAGNGNNDANDNFPANCENAFTVAATGNTNLKAAYSSFGSVVHIAAPGGDRTLTAPDEILSTVDQGYDEFQGTSMAAPHVAGLLALLYSVNPTLTPASAENLITTNVTDFAAGSGDYQCDATQYCGAGIINAGAAVTAANISKPSINWTPEFQVTQNSSSSALLSWNAARWSNAASTPLLYTVSVDGSVQSGCENISTTRCTLTDLGKANNVEINYSVSVTDGRDILAPDTNTGAFDFNLTAPTLTTAKRNPMITTQAWVYYSDPGSLDTSNTYIADNLPGSSVSLDTANQRFVISDIQTGQQVTTTLTLHTTLGESKTSNSVVIPGILAQK